MKTVEAIKGIDWFSNVGQLAPICAFEVKAVSDWKDAIASCSEPNWEDVCNEAANHLTMHLNSVCKAEFQNWNNVIDGVKAELAESWERLLQKLERDNLPTIIADCVRWDTVHGVACQGNRMSPACLVQSLQGSSLRQ